MTDQFDGTYRMGLLVGLDMAHQSVVAVLTKHFERGANVSQLIEVDNLIIESIERIKGC